MASLFNPTGILDLAEQTVRAYIKAASWGERQVFGLIRSGMGASSGTAPALDQSDAEIAERSEDDAESLDAKMHGLLDRAVGQNTASSRQELFHKILDQIVPDDQLSLAIGREGQNARLAARLTGWRIDIRSETEFAAEEAEHGYEEEEVAGRCCAILSNGRRCPNASLPGSRYCGLEAHQALAGTDSDQVQAA